MKTIDVQQHILNTAESFIQSRGYNAFSYRDIAKIVGVKTSSIHYYFPTKVDLAKAVIQKHIKELCSDLESIISHPTSPCQKKLDLIFDGILAKTYMNEHRMCLGGMLASDLMTLPEEIQEEIKHFFRCIEKGLEKFLLLGLSQGEFYFKKDSVAEEVSLIISCIEGSLLLTRLFQDESRFKVCKEQIKVRLTSSVKSSS